MGWSSKDMNLHQEVEKNKCDYEKVYNQKIFDSRNEGKWNYKWEYYRLP